jgi:hypothetical protein
MNDGGLFVISELKSKTINSTDRNEINTSLDSPHPNHMIRIIEPIKYLYLNNGG